MPRPRTEPLEIAQRRQKVASLYLRGKPQSEIAAIVGIDQGNVSRDLAALHKEWLASAAHDFDAKKAEQLARIDHIEAEAWSAWERSCKDAETSHVRIEGKPGAEKTVKEKTTKGQAGDPRFLERIGWCVEQRLKIFGGYAPTKVAPTNPDGTAPYEPGAGDETVRLLDRLLPVLASRAAATASAGGAAVGATGVAGAGGAVPDPLGAAAGAAKPGV